MEVKINMYRKEITLSSLYTRWFTEANVKHFKNGALKLDSHLPKVCFYSLNESPLKKMKILILP